MSALPTTAIPNPRLVVASYPSGYPVPGETTKYDTTLSIDPHDVDLKGGFLTKALYLSLDPYMRNRMRPGGFELGQPMNGYGMAEVLRSEVSQFKPGDILYGNLPFELYTVHPAEDVQKYRVTKNQEGLPLSVYIGIAGMPGKTGYYGLKAIANPKKGEAIFVSTAAGPVGQTVCQFAKAWGLRVIGAAGSDAKVEFLLKELNIDHAFNYKTSSVEEELNQFGGIDIYWDNVGGPTLDAAIAALNTSGRIIICGHASQYNLSNPEEKYGIKNTSLFIYKQLLMKGLFVGAYEQELGEEFYATVPAMIKKGELKYIEDVTVGLDKAGDVLLKVLKGENHGKAVIKI